MTISTDTTRVTVLSSGSTNQDITVSFPYAATSDLVVRVLTIATGDEVKLTEDSDYSVTTPGATGTVTIEAAYTINAYQITVYRDTPMTQSLALSDGGAYSALDLNNAFDKVTKLCAENNTSLTRAMRLPDTDLDAVTMVLPAAASRANKILAFDASGNPTVATTVPTGSLTVSTLGSTMMNLANAAAGRTALGLGTGSLLVTDTDATLAFPTDANVPTQLAVKTYVDTKASLTGNETIAGIKTFSSSPVVPTPITALQASTKGYVDKNGVNYGSGPVTGSYSLTNTPARLDFTTGDPTITLAVTGTYLILGWVNLNYNQATITAVRTITLSYWRSNNTPANLWSMTQATDIITINTKNRTAFDVALPPLIYTTVGVSDVLQLWGSMDTVPSAGSIDAVDAKILAIRLY